MKKILKLILFLIFFFAVFITGYEIGIQNKNISKINPEEKNNKPIDYFEKCPISTKNPIGRGIIGEVIFEPEYPTEDVVIKTDIPFDGTKWLDGSYYKDGWYLADKFDIDGDNKPEQLYCSDGVFIFVKNKKVIFKGTGWCDRVKGNHNGNGFTSVDMLGASIDGIRLLNNYQYVDGGFKLRFYQHICALVD